MDSIVKTECGALINVRSTQHPHFKSILLEGLWGFPEDKRGINLRRWEKLEEGMLILLYCEHKGVRGVWAICKLIGKRRDRKPVPYWIENPQGYPLHIMIEFILPRKWRPSPDKPFKIEWLDQVKPIRKEELVSAFNIRGLAIPQDRWSLFVFGKNPRKEPGVTYSCFTLEAILHEFEVRNIIERPPTGKLDHEKIKDIIYQIGQMQGKYPAKEYPIEDKRIDVVWKRIPRAVPYIVFEVSLKGDLYVDLIKLKHAHDLWNSIPVLVTTQERAEEAQKWIKGTLHEISDIFKVITLDKLIKYYEAKLLVKKLEVELGIL